MNPDVPRREEFSTFQEYKEKKVGEYSADALSHFFNNELGTASNILATLRSRIAHSSVSPDIAPAILVQISEIEGHLAVVHEIGNLSVDLLLRREETS